MKTYQIMVFFNRNSQTDTEINRKWAAFAGSPSPKHLNLKTYVNSTHTVL